MDQSKGFFTRVRNLSSSSRVGPTHLSPTPASLPSSHLSSTPRGPAPDEALLFRTGARALVRSRVTGAARSSPFGQRAEGASACDDIPRLVRVSLHSSLPSSSGQDLRLSSGRYRFDSDREHQPIDTHRKRTIRSKDGLTRTTSMSTRLHGSVTRLVTRTDCDSVEAGAIPVRYPGRASPRSALGRRMVWSSWPSGQAPVS